MPPKTYEPGVFSPCISGAIKRAKNQDFDWDKSIHHTHLQRPAAFQLLWKAKMEFSRRLYARICSMSTALLKAVTELCFRTLLTACSVLFKKLFFPNHISKEISNPNSVPFLSLYTYPSISIERVLKRFKCKHFDLA